MTKTNHTLDLVRYEQERVNAEKQAEQTERRARQEACEKAFQPIMDMFNEVKDIEVKHHDGSQMVKLSAEIANRGKNQLHFWGSYNSFELGCEWGRTGPEFYMEGFGSKKRVVTLDEARKTFVQYLATRIPPRPETKR